MARFLYIQATRIPIMSNPSKPIGNSTYKSGIGAALTTLFGNITIVGGTNGRNFAVSTSSNRNKLKRSERPYIFLSSLKVTKNGFTSPSFH